MSDYTLEIFEVTSADTINKLKPYTLPALGPDEAKRAAKNYAIKLGFEVIRSVNFSDAHHIKLYAARKLEKRAALPQNERVAKIARAMKLPRKLHEER